MYSVPADFSDVLWCSYVVLDTIFPEVASWELLSNHTSGTERNQRPDSHDSSSRVIHWHGNVHDVVTEHSKCSSRCHRDPEVTEMLDNRWFWVAGSSRSVNVAENTLEVEPFNWSWFVFREEVEVSSKRTISSRSIISSQEHIDIVADQFSLNGCFVDWKTLISHCPLNILKYPEEGWCLWCRICTWRRWSNAPGVPTSSWSWWKRIPLQS